MVAPRDTVLSSVSSWLLPATREALSFPSPQPLPVTWAIAVVTYQASLIPFVSPPTWSDFRTQLWSCLFCDLHESLMVLPAAEAETPLLTIAVWALGNWALKSLASFASRLPHHRVLALADCSLFHRPPGHWHASGGSCCPCTKCPSLPMEIWHAVQNPAVIEGTLLWCVVWGKNFSLWMCSGVCTAVESGDQAEDWAWLLFSDADTYGCSV